MKLLTEMQKNNTKFNLKGGKYYATTYDSNLDLFTMLSRYNSETEVLRIFKNAYLENKNLALANLLYILDIREGKGERRLFKIIYAFLCQNYPEEALKIMPFIGTLGRFDYLLEGLNTPVQNETIKLIKDQLELDKKSKNPSLLAKWLPSHRTHMKNNLVAKNIVKALGISEKEYRQTLTGIRAKLNLVETNLTTKNYAKIDLAEVPAKAMLKYNHTFMRKMPDEFQEYKMNVTKGQSKINTKGLFAYEIIKKILMNPDGDNEIYDLMWQNQKEILVGHKNLLVVADTSGSMFIGGAIPYCASIGLALYVAERNQGFFHNHFITFSEQPVLQEIKGQTLWEKVQNMESINAGNTDIDKVFALILKIAQENKLAQKELPEQILIISDMEFDTGVFSASGTNLMGWKKAFKDAGYNLPTIIFWNVAAQTFGIPTTKFEEDVAMVSGFSTNILTNLFTLDKYSPQDMMLEKLKNYLVMLKV